MLNGSIRVLTEILGLVNPATFGRAQRIEQIVRHMAGNGLLQVAKDQVVTRPVIERLKQYAEGAVGVAEPICVMVPRFTEEPQTV